MLGHRRNRNKHRESAGAEGFHSILSKTIQWVRAATNHRLQAKQVLVLASLHIGALFHFLAIHASSEYFPGPAIIKSTATAA